MSLLLKEILLTTDRGAGKKPPYSMALMEYVFTEGTASPYDVMYDTPDGVGPVLIAQSENVSVTGYGPQRKLVRTSDGTLYAVYFKLLAGKYQIYVKKSEDDGATWTDDTLISTADGMDAAHHYFPSIAVDSSDHLHVVWNGQTTVYTKDQIWYAEYDGEDWITPVIISTYAGMAGYLQGYPAIAVDSSDHLHVVWQGMATGYTTRYQIWHALYDTEWRTPVRISTYALMQNYHQFHTSIAVDSSDNLHVVWRGAASGYTTNQIWYAEYDGEDWITPVRISTYANMATVSHNYPSIAVDSSDHRHVVFAGTATGYTNYQVWYAEYDGEDWITPVRISTAVNMSSYHNYRASIAVDENDYLHALWLGKATGHTDQDKVWYATYTDSWATPVCLQPTGKNVLPNLRWSRWPR